MNLIELHDRYWASLGVQVVRTGQLNVPPNPGRLFLLLEAAQLILINLPRALKRLRPRSAAVIQIDIHNTRQTDQHESVRTNDDGSTRRIHRRYSITRELCSTVFCTNDHAIARRWSCSLDVTASARMLRSQVSFHRFATIDLDGRVFDAQDSAESRIFKKQLLTRWIDPNAIDPRITRREPEVWIHESAVVASSVRFIGPVWVGAGVNIALGSIVVGPLVIGDACDTPTPPMRIGRCPTSRPLQCRIPKLSLRRVFDIMFSIGALLVTAPLWPIIIGAIWLDDGWPILYRHRRQTLGGREFNCLKFRTMCRDADTIKAQLQAQNVCDGPQFYIEFDPRETRVGRLLRRFHLDELPQFLNVLAGQMSVVGPRPSPESENQFCPAWRDTRLSVKPGITGLWQVRRTRRPHTDFQEWIRYDTEYVRRRSWWMDLCIIAATLRRVLPI